MPIKDSEAHCPLCRWRYYGIDHAEVRDEYDKHLYEHHLGTQRVALSDGAKRLLRALRVRWDD